MHLRKRFVFVSASFLLFATGLLTVFYSLRPHPAEYDEIFAQGAGRKQPIDQTFEAVQYRNNVRKQGWYGHLHFEAEAKKASLAYGSRGGLVEEMTQVSGSLTDRNSAQPYFFSTPKIRIHYLTHAITARDVTLSNEQFEGWGENVVGFFSSGNLFITVDGKAKAEGKGWNCTLDGEVSINVTDLVIDARAKEGLAQLQISDTYLWGEHIVLEVDGAMNPLTITVNGNVRMKSGLEGMERYLLADRARWDQESHRLVFSSQRGKRSVIFEDRLNQVRMSASVVEVDLLPDGTFGTFRGVGAVRFELDELELEAIRHALRTHSRS